MDSFVDKTLTFLENCDRHVTLERLSADFGTTIGAFGFTHFIMSRIPDRNDPDSPYALAHALPGKWLARYTAQDYVWHDPIAAFPLVTNGEAFTWAEAREQSSKTLISQKIISEGRSFGMVDGMVFQTADRQDSQAIVNLVTDQLVDLDPARRALLEMVCQRAEARAYHLVHAVTPAISLNDRERDVLDWLARHRTYRKAATILSSSKHVGQATKKLRPHGETHAKVIPFRKDTRT